MNTFSVSFIIWILCLIDSCTSYITIQVYIISPGNDKYPFSLNHLRPAADLALKEIQNRKILPHHRLNFVYLNSNCDPNMLYAELWNKLQKQCGAKNNSELIYASTHKLSAFFGPVCSYVLSGLSRMNTNVWKVPIITLGAFAKPFRERYYPDKINEQFKFITAVGYNYLDPSELIMKMSVKYKWKEIIYLSQKDYREHSYDFLHCTLFGIDMFAAAEGLRARGHAIVLQKKYINMTSFDESVNSTFTTEFKDSAIFVICLDPKFLRKVMLAAQRLNLNNGEFVFINVDLFNNPSNLLTPWYLAGDSIENNHLARDMFRSVFIVTWKNITTEDYRIFSREAMYIGKTKYNFTYNNALVNNFVGAFYDSILIYASAVERVLKNGWQVDNGSAVTDAMKNLFFPGISGNVSIDGIGDRRADYSLLDMNKDNWKFRPVATYHGISDQLVYQDENEIDWANKNNSAPPSKPKCGFDNHNCIEPSSSWYYALLYILLTGLIIGIVMGIFIFRRAKFQAQLKAMNWVISADELESLENRYRRLSKREIMTTYIPYLSTLSKKRKQKISRNGSSSRDLGFENCRINRPYERVPTNADIPNLDVESFHSAISIDSISGVHYNNGKLYGCTAVYKGAIVSLKLIKGDKRIETNRDLLLEVKKIKDMNYDHVCRFIGACLESNDQYIVYEYCSKGSLKDILAQKQLGLDWMFKYSLIQDICRGMIYIHQNLGPHGNLKSSNCVVDSRFVLKITDFGCPNLRGREKPTPSQLKDEIYYSSLLWTAPERLRLTDHFTNASFKCDVYSFAIVCQEVIYRKGPFYIEDNEDITAKEKVLEVRHIQSVPFRPSLYAIEGCTEECIKIVSAAWSEDSSSRPDFVAIKAAMRKLNKSGDTGNILDNLLSRMEQYANNLEGLVDKKTEQYLEAKKRAETLLYSMLPKTVAEQLILNQDVIAESFESVTIYFSDIVGFTSLSAESTPMEVVLLLNQLYTTFDKILESYDVYKVETIGDAYVVCSGLPTRNENNHAGEICRMAIAFLNKLFTFEIPHRPNRKLQLRIGIHSGPVCAGVVGVKMPRYCLFGDTVNTSSRMESSGLPQKIHISESTKNILCSFNVFIISERGWVEMKGKGQQRTYWLHGVNNTIVDEIPSGALVVSNCQSDYS